MTDAQQLPDPGFYGKLPVYGDFIRKRLPQDFVAPWDEWLQSGIAAAKERLPKEWLTYYLNCPAWTFVLGSGLCGEQACAGVTIPSVDRVGRYFNFTLATLLPEDTEPASFLCLNQAWLQALEELALTVLSDELDQDGIDNAINGLPALQGAPARPLAFDQEPEFVRLAGEDLPGDSNRALAALTHHLLAARHLGSYGLWRLAGSNQVSAQLLCCAGLPPTSLFLDMMLSKDAEEPVHFMIDAADEDSANMDEPGPRESHETPGAQPTGGTEEQDAISSAGDDPDWPNNNEQDDDEEGDPLLDKFLSS